VVENDKGRKRSKDLFNSDPTNPGGLSTLDTELLSAALQESDVTVFYQDTDLVYRWIENPPPEFPAGEVVGKLEADLFPPELAQFLTREKSKVLSSKQANRISVLVPTATGDLHFDVRLRPHVDERGSVLGLIAVSVNTTEQYRRQLAMRSLLREVNHRSGNLLAIVQSIAKQSSMSSTDGGSFLDSFLGRLRSLSNTQSAIADLDWRGAALSTLVDQASDRDASFKDQVTFSGTDPVLNPQAASHIGLALYELVSNSFLFGALSSPSGLIEVTSRVNPAAPGLEMTWREHDTSSDFPPADPEQFGLLTLERIVPTAIGGEAELMTKADEIVYRLTIPRSAYDF